MKARYVKNDFAPLGLLSDIFVRFWWLDGGYVKCSPPPPKKKTRNNSEYFFMQMCICFSGRVRGWNLSKSFRKSKIVVGHLLFTLFPASWAHILPMNFCRLLYRRLPAFILFVCVFLSFYNRGLYTGLKSYSPPPAPRFIFFLSLAIHQNLLFAFHPLT